VVKYPFEVAGRVAHAATQRHLIEEGLPDGHLLFEIYPPSDVTVRRLPGGTDGLIIGSDHGDLDLCIDMTSGVVVEVNRTDDSLWHVNGDVQKFAQCLEEFRRRYPFGESSNDPEATDAAAHALMTAIRQIDDTALDDEHGYWDSILFDIANGDYAAS
jgi:hypothetical protein